MRRAPVPALLLFPVLLALTSCGFVEGKAQAVLAWGKSVLPAAERPDLRDAQLRTKIQRQLQEEQYLAALTTIRRAREDGFSEKSLASEHLQALNATLLKAEDLMMGRECEEAGIYFRAALDGMPTDASLVGKVRLTPERIESNIEQCADRIMEKGLAAYRSGNLSEAIGLWKKTLAFYPRHGPSRKAIQTAEVQLTNLKTIERPEK